MTFSLNSLMLSRSVSAMIGELFFACAYAAIAVAEVADPSR
jgi:hypothetical protein